MSAISFEAIGTHWTIDIFDEISGDREKELSEAIREQIEVFEQTFSRFRKDSWLNTMSAEAGVHDLPPMAFSLFTAYQKAYEVTGGQVTPLIGQVLVDAGYDAEYSFTPAKEITVPPSWEEVIELQEAYIVIKKPAQFDVGAIGKGYIIDLVAEYLESENIASYCVDAGGDMRARSQEGYVGIRVGIEDPEDATSVLGALTLTNMSIAGSSGNRRSWQNFSHIIDPKTGSSPDHIAAVWVVAANTITADMLTTALYFTAPDVLQAQYEFKYLILNKDRSAEGDLINDPMLELFA